MRTDLAVALTERAATTGFLAANAHLRRWGLRGQTLDPSPSPRPFQGPAGVVPALRERPTRRPARRPGLRQR